jgi:hypothetical protein
MSSLAWSKVEDHVVRQPLARRLGSTGPAPGQPLLKPLER